MRLLRSCNVCGGIAYTFCFRYRLRKCPAEDQANVEINLRHHYIKLLGQQDCGAPAHMTSPVNQYFVKQFGNQIIGYGCVEDQPDLTRLK
ncbi:hypothetical protein TNCV_1402261 [Trichonephila clavipes]|nr:hypothetical protein TNCV_1402261 [Trichonephila clavipes]